MRSWTLLLALSVAVVLAASVAGAVPLGPDFEPSENTGSKTWTAIKSFFRPMTDYFTKELPHKSPSEVAGDVTDKVTDAKEWMQENESVQKLWSALQPVRSWMKETATNLKDKSFKEMFEDVKGRVGEIDQTVGSWIEKKTGEGEAK
ncbi:uncharacterized protein LOC134781779 [Penaeus indicus]|uniref:uncharacterized protein LOC134781779 n=1 Tax=Penaeus indicus TaxID=29960 RepID=UPI00300C8A34